LSNDVFGQALVVIKRDHLAVADKRETADTAGRVFNWRSSHHYSARANVFKARVPGGFVYDATTSVLARNGPAVMSAFRSLSGRQRT
jgi:hypothetical protein